MTPTATPFTHPIHEVLTIPLSDLDMPANGRAIDLSVVDGIADSIRVVGQLQPIVVRRRSDGRRYRLLVGQHRVMALRKLGASYVRAQVVQMNSLKAELTVIDENLLRSELSVLERGEQLARRKEICEALRPETKHGGAPGKAGGGKQARSKEEIISSFAEGTAKKLGVTPRTVRQEVQIAEGISPDVRDAIRDTPIADSKVDLLELARQTPEVQRRVVERVLQRPTPAPVRPVANPATCTVCGSSRWIDGACSDCVIEKADALAPEAASPAPMSSPAPASPRPSAKPVDVRQAIREVRQEQRREEVAARPAPAPETVPARIEVLDATTRWPLAFESVDLIVTSPPYGVGIKYAVGDVNPLDWEAFMAAWMSQAYRVAGEGCRLCVNVPLDTNVGGHRPTYAQTVMAAISVGWNYRTTIVWEEGNVSRSIARGSVDSHAAVNVTCGDEMIAVFHKGQWPRTDGDTADIPHESWLEWTNGHWRFNGEGRAYDGHPAAFPEELARRLTLLFSGRGATVLDPFCGSGTTPAVAHKLGRVAIGFDLDPVWVASTQRRVQEVSRA